MNDKLLLQANLKLKEDSLDHLPNLVGQEFWYKSLLAHGYLFSSDQNKVIPEHYYNIILNPRSNY